MMIARLLLVLLLLAGWMHKHESVCLLLRLNCRRYLLLLYVLKLFSYTHDHCDCAVVSCPLEMDSESLPQHLRYLLCLCKRFLTMLSTISCYIFLLPSISHL